MTAQHHEGNGNNRVDCGATGNLCHDSASSPQHDFDLHRRHHRSPEGDMFDLNRLETALKSPDDNPEKLIAQVRHQVTASAYRQT
jgi:hypothetical protein